MQKVLLSSILFFSLSAHAQIDSTEVDTSGINTFKLPDSTGFGTPDGQLISKEIGPPGGVIASGDGRIELLFPEGALTGKVNISIQPVTNMLNGSDKAYQFEPSGIQFKKPVKIIFHYNDEEAETCPPDLKSFALQDQNGKWTSFEYDEWDSTAKILTGFIHHFSALVADQDDVLLLPDDQNIHVGRKVWIRIMHRRRVQSNGTAVENEFAEFIDDDDKKFGVYVNRIPEGNSSVGTARIFTLGIAKELKYTAPEYLPKKGRIEIKLAFKYYSRLKKKIAWGSSKCNINVYDEYKITVIKIIVKDGTSVLECGAGLEDTSSFKVRLYSGKVEVSDENNVPPSLKKPPNCEPVTYDNVGCEGPVDIRRNRLTGFGGTWDDTGITPPEIRIEFLPAYVKIVNRHGKRPGELHEQTAIRDATVANEIRFRANGKHQGPFEGDECQLIIEPL